MKILKDKNYLRNINVKRGLGMLMCYKKGYWKEQFDRKITIFVTTYHQ